LPTEIIFFRFIPKKDKSGRIERIAGGKPKLVPVLRTFGVYNAEQLEGETEEVQERLKRYLPTVKVVNIEPDFAPAEKLIVAIRADIRYGGDHARYLGGEDRILLPDKRSFESMAAYYETSFHEHFHWAMHPDRVGKCQKQDTYAFNELVADIGACFLCAHLRVPHADTMLEATKQYVASWLASMNNDPRYIFDAAAHASKITDYLLGFKVANSKAA
jgi:antirestriction protein ArdC